MDDDDNHGIDPGILGKHSALRKMSLPIYFVLSFFLIFARIVGAIMAAPLFSRKDVFTMGKLVLMIWIATLIAFVVPFPKSIEATPVNYILLFIMEYMIGFMIGMMADILIVAVEFAGNLMDTQAGLSVASLLDPATGRNVPLLSTLLNWIALLLFLQIDGHHMILSALVESFQILQIGNPINFKEGAHFIVMFAKDIFEIGVILAAPVILIVFVLDFGFGLLNKIAEQVNVFQLSFQVKPTVSLIILLGISPGIVNSIYRIMERIMEKIMQLMVILQG